MIKHLKQREAINDPARFKYLLCGRRGGKTVGIRESILKAATEMPPYSGILYMGPTHDQAMELIWEELDLRMEQMGWKYKPRPSVRKFLLPNGRYIQVLGAEKARRVRGKKYYRAFLDEIAFYTVDLNEIWRAIRPALSDLKGKAVLATTPNGKGTQAYDFYLECMRKEDWKYFHWKTLDNPFIDPVEIESAKRELDEKSFRQEYEAQWESFEGLAYYCFNENVHIKKQPPIYPTLDLSITLDFNVNPTTLLVAQHHDGKHRFKKEYSQKNSSTIETMRSFCEDHKELAPHIRLKINGDSTGDSRKSATGRSDYHYVHEVLTSYGFQYQHCVPSRNPPIIDRVAYVNAALKNVIGESIIEIDPSCRDLIRDLSSQVVEGRFPSDKNNMGHKADAFGYYCYWHHISANRKPGGFVQL